MLLCDWRRSNRYTGTGARSRRVGSGRLCFFCGHPNEEPTAEILTPTSGGLYYAQEPVGFSGVVSDLEDPPEDLLITWSSSIDGVLVSNESPSNEGEIRMRLSYRKEITRFPFPLRIDLAMWFKLEQPITVLPANQAPLCSITTPEDGAVYRQGQGVDFLASASDDQTDTDRLAYIWTSSLEQDILDQGAPTEEGVIQFCAQQFCGWHPPNHIECVRRS